LRLKVFNLFFKEIKNIKLVQQNELMNRECTLFYDDNYLIVASSEFISDDLLPPYRELAENNESIHVSPIENYTIYLINIKQSKLCDSLTFKNDKIILTHNQGVYLFRYFYLFSFYISLLFFSFLL
jgi:de-etiolated-1